MPPSAESRTFLGLGGGLADEPGDEARPVGFDEMARGDHAERPEDLREQTGDRRLAGPGVAAEHEMFRRLDGRKVSCRTHLLDAQQRREASHLLLHVVEPDQRIEFGEQFLDRAFRWEFDLGLRRRRSTDGCSGLLRRGPSVGLAGSGNALGIHRLEQDGAKPIDRSDFAGGGNEVDRRRRMGEVHREPVVLVGSSPPIPGVGLHQEIEHRARLMQPLGAPAERVVVAQRCRRDDHRRGQLGAEGSDPPVEFGTAVAAVGVDERRDEVGGLDHALGSVIGSARQTVECSDIASMKSSALSSKARLIDVDTTQSRRPPRSGRAIWEDVCVDNETWQPPGPGTWESDASHFDTTVTPLMAELIEHAAPAGSARAST